MLFSILWYTVTAVIKHGQLNEVSVHGMYEMPKPNCQDCIMEDLCHVWPGSPEDKMGDAP